MKTPPLSSVGPVREAHRFDEDAFCRYMGFSGRVDIWQFEGGQSNPTFLIESGADRLVMRKKPPGVLLPSAHLVEREYRVMSALRETDVPVPRTKMLCEDAAVIGTPFFVMEWVPGRIFFDPTLPDHAPAERAAIFDAMNDALARLHQVDWRALGLSDFGKPEGYLPRQIARWTKQYEMAKSESIDAMEWLAAWLPANAPDREDTTIAHGDFRIDNLVFHPTEPRVVAILDWELATLGHPLADLAYNCLAYHLPHGARALRGLVGADLEALGIPLEDAYVAAYARRTGRDRIDAWPFFLAFGLFRIASIAVGVAARGRQGNASSDDASVVGMLAAMLAEAGRAIATR